MKKIKNKYDIYLYTINKHNILIYIPSDSRFITVNIKFLHWKHISNFIMFYISKLYISDINRIYIDGRSLLLNKKIISTCNTLVTMCLVNL